MNNQTKEGWEELNWEERFAEILREPTHKRLQSFVSQVEREAEQRVGRQYEDIFSWLLGEKGYFPDLSQKPHYRFRSELRERLRKVKHQYNINN